MAFPRIAHVALTVADLDRSLPWYRQLFGADPVLEEDTGRFRHAVWALGDTLVGLHQFPDGLDDAPFNERRPGLDRQVPRQSEVIHTYIYPAARSRSNASSLSWSIARPERSATLVCFSSSMTSSMVDAVLSTGKVMSSSPSER